MDGPPRTATRSRVRPRTGARSAARNSGPEISRPRRAAAESDCAESDLEVSGLPQLARIIGSIVAPTTLLTALLFYFGWSHAYWFFAYFGVNSTILGLTTQDYLIRSIDGLFVPLTVVTSIGLLARWVHIAFKARLAPESRAAVLRVLVPISAVSGIALLVIGLWGVFARTVFEFHFEVSPLSLASGVLLLSYASHLHRSTTRTDTNPVKPTWIGIVEWAGVFVLVGLGLFWAAQGYSAAVGTSRAQAQASQLGGEPSAIVYSARSLSLHAPGVKEVVCANPDAAYRFRYDGLKLILQSGDQYFFLPKAWSPSDGPAIVVPRSDSLRLEFVLPSSTGDRTVDTC